MTTGLEAPSVGHTMMNQQGGALEQRLRPAHVLARQLSLKHSGRMWPNVADSLRAVAIARPARVRAVEETRLGPNTSERASLERDATSTRASRFRRQRLQHSRLG